MRVPQQGPEIININNSYGTTGVQAACLRNNKNKLVLTCAKLSLNLNTLSIIFCLVPFDCKGEGIQKSIALLLTIMSWNDRGGWVSVCLGITIRYRNKMSGEMIS